MANRETKNVSFTPEHSRFVDERVESGAYQSVSEVVRAGLRLLAAQESSLEAATASAQERFERLLTEVFPPIDDETPEGIALVRKQIAEGLAQAQAGQLIDGDEVMERLHNRIVNHADDEAA